MTAAWLIILLVAAFIMPTPTPSTITVTDWQAWAALLVAFGASFLLKGDDYIGVVLFFAGFLVARFVFW